MTSRIAQMYRIGVAAALAYAVVGSTAQAQTSERRIRVTKDAAGEVLRVDTVMVYRTDTIRVYRTDTMRVNVNVPGPTVTTTNTVTVTRYDTVTMEKLPSWMHRPAGWYFGVGGGPTFANGALHEAQETGPSAQVQLGYDPKGSPLGIRFDANYGAPNQSRPYWQFTPNASVINLSGDLKLRTGNLSTRFPLSMYAIGGGNFISYKDLLIELDVPTSGTIGNNVAPTDGRWHDKWGWNAGGGFAYGWGNHQVFLESRYINFKALNAGRSGQIPFIVGINWY